MTIAYFRPTGCTSPVLTSTTRTARCGRACWVAWQGSGPQGRPLCLFSGRYAWYFLAVALGEREIVRLPDGPSLSVWPVHHVV